MNPTDIIYIAHGLERTRRRTFYSLLSFLQVHAGDSAWFSPHVFTDVPEDFAALEGRCEIHGLSQADLAAWVGDAGEYQNIAKLHILAGRTRSFVFLDSDTLVLRPMRSLAEKIGPDTSLMQVREYKLGQRKEFAELVRRGAEFGVSGETWMYNSGLLGVHDSNVPLLNEALALATKLRVENLARTAEQLADGICLSRRCKIVTAEDAILHYWQDKDSLDDRLDARFASITDKQAVADCISGNGGSFFNIGLYGTATGFAWMMRWKMLLEMISRKS